MLWRVVLFVGALVAVGLMAGSLWVGSLTRESVPSGCLKRPTTGSVWAQQYGCDVWQYSGGPVKTHPEAERNLRYAAGGVLLVTLASLPMLGAGRGRRVPSAG